MLFSKTSYLYFIVILIGIIMAVFFNTRTELLPSTMFYYAKNIPIEQVDKFERVVVEPENTTKEKLAYLKKVGINVYAYLSIGEVGKNRPWINEVNKIWTLGENENWQSMVMDMSHCGWHEFLIENRVKQLWQQGYRGFFLDTMDSYQNFVDNPKEKLAQQQGVVKLIKKMDEEFSGIHLLFNRGFEVIDEVADLSDGIVAESLFVGWDSKTAWYKEIEPADHQWLLEKLTYIRDKYNLPVTVIDYLPADQKEKAKEVASKILSLGFVPWVSTVELDQVSVGINSLGMEGRKIGRDGLSK